MSSVYCFVVLLASLQYICLGFKQQYRYLSSICMNRYELLQEIGHGAYSIVYKAHNLQRGQIVAIKRINHKNPQIGLILQRQISTLRALHHPNIIPLLQLYSDANFTYLVFQYIPYDLITYYKHIKKTQNRNLNDEQITYITWQICSALNYMHQCGVMHRDIKPQNILINPKNLTVKLIDFGFAKGVRPTGGVGRLEHTQYMITRWYRPLEIVLGIGYDGAVDVFALGALVMELYLGEEIFRSASNLDQLSWVVEICGYPKTWPQAIIKISQLGITFNAERQPQIIQMVQGLRREAADLIISMLQTCPSDRIKISHLLQHPYFSSFQRQNIQMVQQSSQPYFHPQQAQNHQIRPQKSLNTKGSNILTKSYRQIENTNLVSKQSNIYQPIHSNNSNHAHTNHMYTNNQVTNNNVINEKITISPHQNSFYQQQPYQGVRTSNFYSNSPHHTSITPQHTQSNPLLTLDLKNVGTTKSVMNGLQPSTERVKQSKDYNPPLSQRKSSYNYAQPQQKQRQQKHITNELHAKQEKHVSKQKQVKASQLICMNMKTSTGFQEQSRQPREQRHKTEGYDTSRYRKSGYLYSNDNMMAMSTKNSLGHPQITVEQDKGLKNRTKSFQGINVMSLKRNSSNTNLQSHTLGTNPQKNMIYTFQTPSSNPKKQDLHTYLSSIARQNSNPIPSRKQATFTKIRDKLTHENIINNGHQGNITNVASNRAVGKFKISLTDRHQFHYPQSYGPAINASPNGFFGPTQVALTLGNQYERKGWGFNLN